MKYDDGNCQFITLEKNQNKKSMKLFYKKCKKPCNQKWS